MSNKSTDLVSRMRALSNSKAPWFDLEKLNALDLLNSAADEIERLQEFINSEFFKRVTYKQENDRLRTVLGGVPRTEPTSQKEGL